MRHQHAKAQPLREVEERKVHERAGNLTKAQTPQLSKAKRNNANGYAGNLEKAYGYINHINDKENISVNLKKHVQVKNDHTYAKIMNNPSSKCSLNKNQKLLKAPLDRPFSAIASEAYKQSVNSVFDKMLYPDIVFIVGDTEFPAHKCALAARSSFFENMFSSGMKESKDEKIKFDDMSPAAFSALLRFIYGAEFSLTESSALELLQVADKYSLSILAEIAEDFLIENLNNNNITKLLEVAETIDRPKLKTAILSFIEKNIETLTEKGVLLGMPKCTLIELLERAQFEEEDSPVSLMIENF